MMITARRALMALVGLVGLLLAVAAAAMVPALLAGCGTGGKSASSSTPEPTVAPTASPQPASASEELACVPSGSLLFLVAMGYSSNLYLVSADGSGLTELTDSTENDTPGAFSPNGTLLAYNAFLREDRADGVYVMSPDGTNPRLVTDGGSWAWFLSWSAAGRILFLTGGIGPSDYWTVNANGSDLVRILKNESCNYPADWSPDGQNLVVCQCNSTPDDPTACDLSIVDQQGNMIRHLLKDDPRMPYSPRWSPDGSHILFLTRIPDGRVDSLFVMDADGANVRSLYQFPVDSIWSLPWWSPDGSRVALTTGDEIVVVSLADGSSRTVATGKNITYLAWSPSGDKIAYVSEHDGSKLYVADSNGGRPVDVADPASNTEVSWSPDGKQILFASNRKRQEGVWWASPDGSERGRLDALSETWVPPAEPAVEAVVGGCKKGSLDNSCLSPDGKSEAVVYPNAAAFTIRDLASGGTRDITIDGADVWNTPPVWSSYGTKIALYAGAFGKGGLYVVDLATGNAQLVATGVGSIGFDSTIAWAPDDSYVYYTKGMICGEGCAPGFLYRVRPDGTGEERVVDMRVSLAYGFKP
jgi:TolB protein